ncbi:MAG: YcaO-like family protein, partial [Thermoanaerobaculia bacterium]|nr:YcaO-like family protein [Thermoanaerobaculia bacterium]
RGSGSAWLESLVSRFQEVADRWVAWDATSSLGLPVIVVDLVLDDLPLVFRGSGCHTSPAVAASRALTEAAQSRLTYISGAREDVSFERPRWREVPADRFRAPPPERSFSDLPDLASATVAGDLRTVLERLAVKGREAFAVPLRRPEIDLPVWFAFVPGLREARHV